MRMLCVARPPPRPWVATRLCDRQVTLPCARRCRQIKLLEELLANAQAEVTELQAQNAALEDTVRAKTHSIEQVSRKLHARIDQCNRLEEELRVKEERVLCALAAKTQVRATTPPRPVRALLCQA